MKGSENPAKLDGKIVVITGNVNKFFAHLSMVTNVINLWSGANAGIGRETANDMYKRGASVIMLCRAEERAKAAIKWITENNEENSSKGSLRLELCDLSSMKSVKNCADRLLGSLEMIDILVNNAGTASGQKITTDDGFELTLATNHLGPFLLTELLMPLLKKSAESGFRPR